MQTLRRMCERSADLLQWMVDSMITRARADGVTLPDLPAARVYPDRPPSGTHDHEAGPSGTHHEDDEDIDTDDLIHTPPDDQ